MEPIAGLKPLAQLGAVGVILAVVLSVVLILFKRFVDNMIDSNRDLSKQNFDMQLQTLTALNSIKTEITAMKNDLSADIRELDHTTSNLFNEISAVTGGSRGYSIGKPPRRGG